MAWMKALHISALLIWCAGLVYMPGLLLEHRHVVDTSEFARIRRATRFAYTAITSPAAFVAIASGTALLFMADAMHGWMFAKLAFVGLLVGVHLQYGAIVTHLAEQEADPPRRWLLTLFGGQMAMVAAILFLVLAEPYTPTGWLPAWMLEPGALQSSFARTIPI